MSNSGGRPKENPVNQILSLLSEQNQATFGINQQLEILAASSAKTTKELEELTKEVNIGLASLA